jgi:hypothetical protein
MTRVLVLKDWTFPDHRQHTPGASGFWDGVEFVDDASQAHDYVVVMNRVPKSVTVRCSPEHIWGITQEPPVYEYQWLREGFANFYEVFTPDVEARHPRIRPSHGALPWHVGKSYDQLKSMSAPEKPSLLSWVTSSATGRVGRQQRMSFLETLQTQVKFDLFGRGFQPIDDKWDGLAPYRYALAVENHSGPYYWTEKLADAFLAWSMPIYHGCTNISDYFPEEAMIRIDITQPQEAIEIIQDAIHSNLWLQRRDAIAHARELVLDQHQFFPFIVRQIRQGSPETVSAPRSIHLPELPYAYPQANKPRPHFFRRWRERLRKFLNG